jgi:hypothetical protein
MPYPKPYGAPPLNSRKFSASFGRESQRRIKKTVWRTEWVSNKLRPAHTAQRAKENADVHATLFCLPLPHRYPEAMFSEGGLQRRRIDSMGE